ncbi:MAG: Ig-like domain-containing protein [bacterium]|nr:Ig-like domain-containing protein [bacterium]
MMRINLNIKQLIYIVLTLGIFSTMKGCVESKIEYFPDTGPSLRIIHITPNAITLIPGQTDTLHTTLLASDSTVLQSLPLEWISGNPTIAQVDSLGIIRAVNRGRTYIHARYQGIISNTVGITVTYPPRSFDLRPDSSFVLSSGSVQLEWIVLDSLGNNLDIEPYLFSSDTSIAMLDPTGRVTGRNEGIAKIYGTIFQLIDSVLVYVSSRYDSVRITPTELAIQLGTTAQLTCLGWLNNRIIYPTVVEWRSSHSSIASVNSQGLVFGDSIGYAYITAATGNSVSLPIRITVEPTPPENEFLVVATEDSLWEIGTETRSKRFHYRFSNYVQEVRKHPTEKKVAVLTDNHQLFYYDLMTQNIFGPISATYSEDTPLAFSSNGEFLWFLGSDLQPKSIQLSTMNIVSMNVPNGFINFRWSKLPLIENNHWIYIGQMNNREYYLVNNFQGNWVDTSLCNINVLGPIYDVQNNSAFDVHQNQILRCSLISNEITTQFVDTLSVRLRRWLSISRNHSSVLVLGELNHYYQLDIPIFSSPVLEHPALQNYTHLTFYPSPFEAYGAFGTQVFRLTSRYPIAFSWLTFFNSISAMDR